MIFLTEVAKWALVIGFFCVLAAVVVVGLSAIAGEREPFDEIAEPPPAVTPRYWGEK